MTLLESQPLDSHSLAAIEARTLELGTMIFEQRQVDQPPIYQRRWWNDRLMDWSMRNERLKVELFRFIDVLPMLSTGRQVADHLHEYMFGVRDCLPTGAHTALAVARSNGLGRAMLASASRIGARDFARRFIAGTNVEEVMRATSLQREAGCGFTLDILGEAVASDTEADRYHQAYLDLIQSISPKVNDWPEQARVDQGVFGSVPRMNLSVKLSALDSQFDPIDFEGTTKRVSERLRELLRKAAENQAFINVDMESYDKKDITLHIFKQVLEEEEFRHTGDVGIVIQCYLRDAERDLIDLRDWARRRGHAVWVRLVKGAYWDYETVHARESGWPLPVFQQKWKSDACFEKMTRFIMQNIDHLRPAVASHNIRSMAHCLAAAEVLELPDRSFEIQMLYGMADGEKRTLCQWGHRVRVYMPYGELIPGMAYLVRRLLENTSNDSFLQASFSKDVSPDVLLASPAPTAVSRLPSSDQDLSPTGAPNTNGSSSMVTPSPETDFTASFTNEPPIDFAREENRRAMEKALANVRDRFGRYCPLVIDGQPLDTDERLESFDPSDHASVVGTSSMAELAHVDKAVAAATRALPDWRQRSAEQRAACLRKGAEAMRGRYFELAAWLVYECGKPWREAAGDITEAIDFCEYYATGAEVLFQQQGHDVPGETNRFVYRPRGVAAVIAPWNFPFAILTGMTVAALATGNTVVMKPASQSPIAAMLLMEIFQGVGIPAGVLNYLPGHGSTIGTALVEHRDVAMIAFTGSRGVGLDIHRRAAKVSAEPSPSKGPGRDTSLTARGSGAQPSVKQVIAEMGGKNVLIVDDNADLDEAVLGVVPSAFGFQGQKCSACSRVVVLEKVYDTFLERLVEATRSLHIGPADDPATRIGPLIDAGAVAKSKHYMEVGRAEGREVLAVEVGALGEKGHFVGPHIFADIAPGASLAQEEVFGPVLAVMRAADLSEAIRIANGTEYALTAGIFSRSPTHLKRAAAELEAGNVYLNRGITGALVSRQPFGGYRLSGRGGKAGGPDYLLQFVVARTITENTMRRGFAPESSEA